MTPKQFFKLYPSAQSVWQVADDLYFEAFEKSAREHADRAGVECKQITRSETESVKEEKKG